MEELLIMYNSIKPYKYPLHPKVLENLEKNIYSYCTIQIFTQVDPEIQYQHYQILIQLIENVSARQSFSNQCQFQIPFYIDIYQTDIVDFFYEIAQHISIYQLIDLLNYLKHNLFTHTDNITVLNEAINYAKIYIPELKIPEITKNIVLPIPSDEEVKLCKNIYYSNTKDLISYNLSELEITLSKSTIQKLPYHKFTQINPFGFKYILNKITPEIQSIIANLKVSDDKQDSIYQVKSNKIIIKKLYTLQELYNYQILDHPNINKLFMYTNSNTDQFLIFKDLDQTNLDNFLNATKLSDKNKLHLIHQLVQVILDLHTHNFYHGDLKELNIIVYPDLTLKLIDLEKTAHKHDLRFTPALVHLPPYLPPEAYLDKIYRYNHRIDTIPLIIIISRILTNNIYNTIKDFLNHAHNHLPQPLMEMLLDPEKLTIHDIINHWFNEK